MNSPFSLKGKTILITGASSGIGRATAIECAKAGASCILLGRNKEKLEETASFLSPGTAPILSILDLNFMESYEEIIEEYPILDGIVCNAGINYTKLLQSASLYDLNEIFDVNCFSPVILLRHLLKKRKVNKGASIVFTSSISGYSNVSVGNGIYGASKSALTSFMKYFAMELAPKSIRCNAIHPGRIETPLISKNALDEDALLKDISKYPLKRYGKPEEVAYAIIYLLSDAAAWVTGTSLVIDGGRSLV